MESSKLFAIAALVSSLSLVSCGERKKEEEKATEAPKTEAPAAPVTTPAEPPKTDVHAAPEEAPKKEESAN